MNYGDSITNMEIIALLAIHLNSGIKVPRPLVKAATDTLNRELADEELSSWSQPEKRREVLLQLLAAIGGKRKSPKPPKVFNHPAIHFRNLAEARVALLKLGRMVKTRQGTDRFHQFIDDESAAVPPFIRTLDRLMHHRIWETDFNIHWEAWRERQMMLMWYLWLTTHAWKDDDLTELAEMLDLPSRWLETASRR